MALTLSIGGILIVIVPFLNILAAPALVAGFVCALVGLIGRGHGGRGLSIAALVTSSAAGVLAVVLVVASLILVGFGSLWDRSAPGTRPAPPVAEEPAEHGAEHELVTVESAFGRTAFDETLWWYAVIIDNPNDDAVFENADVLVHAIDPDGVLLDTGWDYVSIAPGRTAFAGMFLDIGDSEITRLEVELPAASGATVVSPDELGAVTVNEAAAAHDSGGTIVSGTVTSTFATPQPDVRVTVVARDAAGTIIDADWSFADALPAGGSAPFEVRFYEPLPADTVFEAYPTL